MSFLPFSWRKPPEPGEDWRQLIAHDYEWASEEESQLEWWTRTIPDHPYAHDPAMAHLRRLTFGLNIAKEQCDELAKIFFRRA